jgi:mRNA-degrading endonuclease RelE of RelBE toxin-antitoxin system
VIQSRTTREFREAFGLLPNDIRRQAQRAYRLFCTDPRHPSLRFKKVNEESNVYSVRIGLGYRALGVMEGSTVVWFWIGSHAECDRLLR